MLQWVAVCCSVLRCVVLCCSVLKCVAMCCNVVQFVAMCCNVFKCVAVCCRVLPWNADGVSRRPSAHTRILYGVLQSVAVKCRWRVKKAFCTYTHTVWHVAECCREMQMACQEGLLHIHAYCMACCRVLQCVCSALQCVAVRCSVLQCVAVRCSVLQCVAVCCSV